MFFKSDKKAVFLHIVKRKTNFVFNFGTKYLQPKKQNFKNKYQ